MKIAIIGIRGIPVIYSGFETLAEKLSLGLVRAGHKVTVYARRGYGPEAKSYKGIKLINLPSPRSKNWETFVHSFLSTLHACFRGDYDLVYFIGVGSAIFALLPRILGIKTAVNVDGLDWRREKWGPVGKAYLAASELLACYLPNVVITDSLFIKRYYRRKFAKETVYLPYGYEPHPGKAKGILERFGLTRGKYLVWVGRLVPDNHTDELVAAFKGVKTPFKCVVIGDDRLNGLFRRKMLSLGAKDPRIIFTGFLERERYSALVKNAFLYVETKRSGGTHPSLVEAMGFGTPVVSNDHPGAREVLGKGAIFYNKGSLISLRKVLKAALSMPKKARGRLAKETLGIVKEKYSWGKIINGYEKLFLGLIGSAPRRSPGS